MKILSLFANIGIAEARLNELEDAEVVVANELVPRRASLYQQIYPYSRMICGNILNPDTVSNVCRESMRRGVDVIMATPPCQGISTAGKMLDGDERNSLTVPVIRITEKLRPRYVLIENVPGYVSTRIEYSGESRLITDIIREHLGNEYHISINVVDMSDYGVPQTRKRTIVLLSRNDQPVWNLPAMYPHKVTMREAIGDIPVIDPFVKDLTPYEFHRLFPRYESRKKAALAVSRWNIPPAHVYRQVLAMQHTPTGGTAFDNPPEYRPAKKDGTPAKGFRNTYMRQRWDMPAYTVTMANRKISSQGNVHPGRPLGRDKDGSRIYSDPRVLTLYELMRVMTIPDSWPLPDSADEPFVRSVIGEGIPPLFTKQLFSMIR